MAKATTVSVLQKEVLLKIEKFTEKQLCCGLFFDKIQICDFIKKRDNNKCIVL